MDDLPDIDGTVVRRRRFAYVAMFAVLFFAYLYLRDSTWHGDIELHTLMETVATVLSLAVGCLALLRFYSNKDNTFLFIGTGFVATAFLDGYHAVVSSSHFIETFPSTPPALIAWSWFASRIFLSMLLWLSWLMWRRQDRRGAAGRVSESLVYGTVVALALACFAVVAFVPLPAAYYRQLVFPRPQEFVPALFFLLALIGYLRKGKWKLDAFEHWLVLSLIVSFMGQTMFMSFSGRVYDMMFDAAHLLKAGSYICAMAGLLVSMLHLFSESLAHQELQFKNVLLTTQQEVSPDAILVVNEQAKIISYNRHFVELWGLPQEMVEARVDEPVLQAVVAQVKDADAFLARVKYLYEHSSEKSHEEISLKDGRIIDRYTAPMNGEDGKYCGRIWFFRDITERKRAEVARDQMVAILESTTDLVATSDPDGRILYMNGAGRSLLGVGIDEDITKTVIADFLPDPASHPILSEGIPAAVRQGSWSGETVLLSRRGPEIPVSQVILCHKAPDGKIETLSTIMRDITERKHADAELLQFATELDQRIFAAAAANDALQRQTEESQRLTVERAALAKMNDLLLACASSDEAFDIFGRAAPELFESSTGALHIYAASRNQLTPAATWGEWPDAVMPFSPEHCWGLRRGNYYLGNGTSTPPCEHAGSFKVGATLCVPLMAYGEVLGVLHLRGPDASTLQSRLQLVTLAGDGLAITLANIRLRQTLKEQAIRDPLTGLFNRRYLTETLVREFARAQRSGAPMAIVMIDVDHFKRFNDSFGHDAGDAVLQALGSFFVRSVRADDIACRYGGEEFCLVLPQMDHHNARQRAEAIRAGAAALEVKSDGKVLGPVTLSLGVALFPEDGSDMESLVHAADAALYEAKKAGRNRVEMTSAAALLQPSETLDQKEQSI